MKIRNKAILMSISFLTPIVIMIGVLFKEGIYPYSNNTLLNYDMLQQYVPFFVSLRSIVSGDNSIFYNWSAGLGGDYWGLYFYYLASPFSWITLLWDVKDIPTAIYFLTLIKIGFCGLSFSIFLMHRTTADATKKTHGIILFSCCYALMSYNMMYNMCLMWIDGVIMLPLVMLGLDRIVNRKKTILFVLMLSVACIINYYTAFMIGLFSILYLLYLLSDAGFLNRSNISKTLIVLKNYILNSLLAIGTSAVVLLPVFILLTKGKLTSYNAGSKRILMHSLIDILKRIVVNDYDTITSEGLPLLFCGTASVVLFILFLFNSRNNIQKLTISIFIISILLISFWLRPLNIIWHGFREPESFPHRFSFVWGFYILQGAERGYAVLCQWGQKYKRYLIAGIWMITAVELFMTAGIYRAGINVETANINRTEFVNSILKKSEYIDHIDAQAGGNIYRIEDQNMLTYNDAYLYGYNGIQSFTSTYNSEVLEFMKAIGYTQYQYKIQDTGRTLASDSLLGVKYVVGAIVNEYALPIGFVINDVNSSPIMEWENNPFSNINTVYSNLIGDETSIYHNLECDVVQSDKNEASVTFNYSGNEELYMYLYLDTENIIPGEKIISISCNDTQIDSFELEKTCIKRLEYSIKGENCIKLYGDIDDIPFDVYIAAFDKDKLISSINKIKDNGTIVESCYQNGNYKGHIDVKNSGRFIITIPYYESMDIIVDGVKVKTEKFVGVFPSVKITEGEHLIEMKYRPPELVLGSIISLFSIIIVLVNITHFWYYCK